MTDLEKCALVMAVTELEEFLAKGWDSPTAWEESTWAKALLREGEQYLLQPLVDNHDGVFEGLMHDMDYCLANYRKELEAWSV